MADKLKQAQKLDDEIKRDIYGVDSEKIVGLGDQRDRLSAVLEKFNTNVGNKEGNLIELMASVAANPKGSNNVKRTDQYNDTKRRIEKSLNSENLNYLNQMMVTEKDRILKYQNYRMIHKMIPQISEAVKTIVDNIISPDDFTKTSLNISIPELSSEDAGTFERNVKSLLKTYNIEEKLADYIERSLALGDLFVFVDPIGEAIVDKILNEEQNSVNAHENEALDFEVLTEETVLISDQMINEHFVGKVDPKALAELKREVAKYVNENVEITADTSFASEEVAYLKEDFEALLGTTKKKPEMSDLPIDKDKTVKEEKLKKIEQVDRDIAALPGSVVKELLPERVIKLWADGFNYGYYYIDSTNNKFIDAPRQKDSTTSFNNLFNLAGLGSDVIKNKQEFMYELIFSSIVKKVNKKFVADNPEFRKIIYNALQQREMYVKKIKIIYIPPQKVVHFHPSANDDVEYGTSIYADVLFTAKLYLSVLISMLMMMLVRGADKRAWYVETGIEGDQEAVINRAIQDVKGREIKMNDFGDLQHVISMVGMFDDYFFPMFDGEKPLDMEIIEGQKPEFENNEFLEYLRKTMLSGMGVPPAHLGYTEDLELAKTLAMINGKFIRRVITFQKAYGPKATKFITILYKNEYGSSDSKENSRIVPDKIEATFPSPASLNYTNLTELIGNAEGIISKIVDTLVSDQENAYEGADIDTVRYEFTKEVTKKMIPNIDWDTYNSILLEVAKTVIKNTDDGSGDEEEEDGEGIDASIDTGGSPGSKHEENAEVPNADVPDEDLSDPGGGEEDAVKP